MIGRLQTSITVSGIEYDIRTDYRNVLDAFMIFNDEELEIQEKWICVVYMMIDGWTCVEDVENAVENGFDISECLEELQGFFSCHQKPSTRHEKPVFDWEQDEQILFSSINKIANTEVRELDYLHWWSFLGYFNEIGEGQLSYIVGIRRKKNKGEKLTKDESRFYKDHKETVDLVKRHTKEESDLMEYLDGLL